MLPQGYGILAISILFLFVSITTAQRSSFGEECNTTRRCDRRSWLGCHSGKCECLKPDEMIYQPTLGKCASKAGERCKYAMEHSDGSRSFEMTSCVENSICGDDGFCTCAGDYYENTNGTCSFARQFSESCDNSTRCSSLASLFCQDGVCNCLESTSLYSSEENQCVGLAGQVCLFSKCIRNANCASNRCICEEGYFEDAQNKCERRFDVLENCTSHDQCKDEVGFPLKCIEGVCKCDPRISIFGAGRKMAHSSCGYHHYGFQSNSQTQCLGKAGSPCLEGMCASGSYCDHCDNYCKCSNGYERSSSGTCGRPYGGGCESAGTCKDGLICHAWYQPSSNNNRCECRYPEQTYETSKGKCTSPVGHPCDQYTACVDGAECIKMKQSSAGTCQCRKGYVESEFGKCDVAFEKPCDFNTRCDVVAGLDCIEGICQCRRFMQFSPELQRCLGLVGQKCELEAKIQQCVPNAKCMKVREEHTVGRCTCSEAGLVILVNYTCEAEMGANEVEDDVPVLSFPVVYDDVDASGSGEE